MLTFELSVDEANTILNALAAQPYNQVATVIAKMQQQGAEQIEKNPDLISVSEEESDN